MAIELKCAIHDNPLRIHSEFQHVVFVKVL